MVFYVFHMVSTVTTAALHCAGHSLVGPVGETKKAKNKIKKETNSLFVQTTHDIGSKWGCVQEVFLFRFVKINLGNVRRFRSARNRHYFATAFDRRLYNSIGAYKSDKTHRDHSGCLLSTAIAVSIARALNDKPHSPEASMQFDIPCCGFSRFKL